MINYQEASLPEFALVRDHVEKIKTDLIDDNSESELCSSNAFYYLVLDLILDLNENEIEENITDTYFLKLKQKCSGHDRGIDALYIDENSTPPKIHFFNCKYTEKFEKTENHFPSSEIDKITGFINELNRRNINLTSEVNPILAGKIKQIWSIFDKHNPELIFHFCSNGYKTMEEKENKRLKNALSRQRVKINYFLMPDIVNKIRHENIIEVNAKMMAIGDNFFGKTNGGIKAIIGEFNARDLIKISCNNEELRQNPSPDNYNDLLDAEILEDAFKDNVRIYLKQRTKINKSIKETLLSQEKSNVFYYNNGITIICEKLTFNEERHSPIVSLENLQIVNGCQTINSIFEAYKENPSEFKKVNILCRIYETSNEELSTKIAEYTNSQNPVKSRDIRSIDYYQEMLEKQLATKGYFYERKKNQFKDQPKAKRIDSEAAGQILCAFYNDMPVEAKNKKAIIFGEKYDDIFHDSLDANQLLLAWKVSEYVEQRKKEKRLEISNLSEEDQEKEIFIVYASAYILFIIKYLAEQNDIDLSLEKFPEIINLYDSSVEQLEELIVAEESIDTQNINRTNFFKSNKIKISFLNKLEQLHSSD